MPPHKDPKSTVWCPNYIDLDSDPLGLGVRPIQDSGFVLLGSPIGDAHFIDQVINEKIRAIEEIVGLLPSQRPSLRVCAASVLFLFA